ncbi:hypothetical protein MLIT_12800 [Mycolicibacterium litorale]|uniref:Uncharacterized protein n=2 Tax=Mycolicibacterium litorale TaxID=758802 RepID=A0AAD1MT10_9MYCO|nr:hypothetical protein MLIT_12800 [Mycolicibacterium litorale]
MGLTFGPAQHPSAVAECPKCKGTWPVWEREQVLEVCETAREVTFSHEEAFTLDNRSARSLLKRTKSIEHQWSQVLEIGREESKASEVSAKLPVAGMEFGALAKNTLSSTYKITASQSQTFTDTLEFEVPPGVSRTVTLKFKKLWQCGHVVLRDHQGAEIARAPFRVVVGLDLDVSQNDST